MRNPSALCFSLTLVAGLLSACSSTSTETASADSNKAKSDSDLICEYYRPTGTKLKQKICKTVAQKRAEQEKSEQDMAKVHAERARLSGYTTN